MKKELAQMLRSYEHYIHMTTKGRGTIDLKGFMYWLESHAHDC